MDPLKPDATPEEITAWVNAAIAKITELSDSVAAAQSSLDEANSKLAEIDNAKSMAEIDALLADYDMPDESKAAMIDLAKTNRPQATALLAGMSKKKAPEVVPPTPSADPVKPEAKKEAPAPMHNPGKEAPMTPEAKAAAAEKLVVEIRKAPNSRFPAYEAARAEARRQKPGLFS